MDVKTENEELNLLTLFKKFKYFISINWFRVLICFVLYFLLGSYYYYFVKPNEYQSSLTISSKVLKVEDANSIIKPINNYIKGRELEVLSEILDLTLEEAKSLTSINADYLEDDLEKKEQSKEKLDEEKFVITVKASNNMVFEKLNKPILKVLKNSEYYKIKVNLNKTKLTNLYSKLDNLISQLDTINPKLFETYNKSNTNSNSIFLSNPGNLSETIIELLIARGKASENLVYETELITIQKFQNYSSIENKFFNKFLISMLIISMILSFLTISFFPKRKIEQN